MPLPTCRIDWRALSSVIDSDTPDRDPDAVPLPHLSVKFSAGRARIVTTSPPETVFLHPLECTTDEQGYLVSPDGQRGLYLVASDIDPENVWTWTVRISSTPTSPHQITAVSYSFVAPSGGSIDLSTVIPVPAVQGRDLPAWQEAVSTTVTARGETLAARDETVTARDETIAAHGDTLVARDETVTARDETIAAHGDTLAARDETVTARDETIAAHGETLVARDETVAARDETVTARGETLVARDETVTARGETLAARDETVTARDETLTARDETATNATGALASASAAAASATTAQDAATTATNAATTAALGGFLSGTGSPQGVVAAPVGSQYRDTAATAGAVIWVKASDTGTSGWVVQHGDTGWRQISPSNVTSGTVAIRRINSTVLYRMSAVIVTAGSGNLALHNATNPLPDGFRGHTDSDTDYRLRPISAVTHIYQVALWSRFCLSLLSSGTRPTAAFLGTPTWHTDDPWPTTLPGSPTA